MTQKELALEGLTGRTPLNVHVKDTGTEKGRGVFSMAFLSKGSFVCEYETDDVFPRRDLESRLQEYDENDELSYVVEAKIHGKWMCFDATRRYSGVGRYMNHGQAGVANCKLHPPLLVRGKWRLAIMAARDISEGEELLWDYNAPPEGIEWLKKRPTLVSCE